MRSFRHTVKLLTAAAICSAVALLAAALLAAGAAVQAGLAILSLFLSAVMGLLLLQTVYAVERIQEQLLNGEQSQASPDRRWTPTIVRNAFRQLQELRDEDRRKLREREGQASLRIQLLQQQKKNVEAVIYSIHDAVVVTDACDRIVVANSAAEELFGFSFTPDQTSRIGKAIGDCEFTKLVVRSRQSRIPHVRHELVLGEQGEPKTFDCVISCVQEDGGAACGVVAVLHDITREREVSQMKSDFVSHVSHELKTPLASINAYAEMLVDGEAGDAETMQKFCGIIQSQAARLNRLIDDILNISRIESGLIKVSKEHCSVAILAQNAVEAIKSYAIEKNITVNSPPLFVHDQVSADQDMITQVIINLLSNAVKYTPGGGTVDISVEVDDSDACVRLYVSDTGIGIPPDDLPHVFDKFYRVEANKKQAKGTGLGLNLVKQIVERVHGGRVFATSVPQKGSTFGIELPLAEIGIAQNA